MNDGPHTHCLLPHPPCCFPRSAHSHGWDHHQLCSPAPPMHLALVTQALEPFLMLPYKMTPVAKKPCRVCIISGTTSWSLPPFSFKRPSYLTQQAVGAPGWFQALWCHTISRPLQHHCQGLRGACSRFPLRFWSGEKKSRGNKMKSPREIKSHGAASREGRGGH